MLQRFHLFPALQKAQRYALCDTTMQLSALEAHARLDIRYVLAQVRDTLDFCRRVSETTAMCAAQLEDVCGTGEMASVALACDERLRSMAGMLELCEMASGFDDEMPAEVLADLQSRWNAHVARALAVLDFLDRACEPLMRLAGSGAARAALEDALLAGLTPAALGCGMQWMLPALSGSERAGLVDMLHRRVGRDFTTSVLAMSKDLLSRADCERLLRASDVADEACV